MERDLDEVEEVDLSEAAEEFLQATMDDEYSAIAMIGIDHHGYPEIIYSCDESDLLIMVRAFAERFGYNVIEPQVH